MTWRYQDKNTELFYTYFDSACSSENDNSLYRLYRRDDRATHWCCPIKMQASSWHRVETIAISANCSACRMGVSIWLQRYEFTYLRTNGVFITLRKTVAIYRQRSILCTVATKSADHRQSRIMVALPITKHRRRLSRMGVDLRRVR